MMSGSSASQKGEKDLVGMAREKDADDKHEGSLGIETNKVLRVVLTGGPCGGKTTSQSILSDALENRGINVYRVSETAAILLRCGVLFEELSDPERRTFQINLLRVLTSIERCVFDMAELKAAKTNRPSVVICDRGTMDGSAYIPRDAWLDILKELNYEEVDIRDNRYDMVFHMVTAADGAEHSYTLQNSEVRTETPELARHLDALCKSAWVGHPYLEIIDNSTDFETKCARVIKSVLERLGFPKQDALEPLCKRKFLLRRFISAEEILVPCRDFKVQHNYLLSSPGSPHQARIRRRFVNEVSCNYSLSIRTFNKGDVSHVERRRALTGTQYNILLKQADASRCSVVKLRRCFVHKNVCFQIDLFETARPGLVLMEAYVPRDRSTSQFLPPFVDVEREVTGDPAYSMYNLSLRINQS